MNDAGPAVPSVRELRVAGEIAQAFLTARKPTEVYRIALERVAPLVGAHFGCVFLREGDSDLLQIVTAYNWPQRYAPYLGTMRVRIGNGPTGRAVLENRLVDAADIFDDAELGDWWDSARELGFNSAIALPLAFEMKPVGSLTFYFRDAEAFRNADRNLLRLVASQLAATAEKAHLIDDLQTLNERLREKNQSLEGRYREAEESRRAKDEFLANVSHELRTPLTAILGYVYLLKEGVTGELKDAQHDAVRKIELAGGRLLSLIDGLLDLTNLKLGRVATEPELCDAAALSRTAIANAPAPAHGVDLRADAPDRRLPIHTDPFLVLRILDALLSNALKFTGQGSVVLHVRIEEDEITSNDGPTSPTVVWEIRDTGIGIEEKNHERIFEEFHQADGSATRRYGGAGLGLAVARGLARRLGGEIDVRSRLGEGATFVFSLPTSVVQTRSLREKS